LEIYQELYQGLKEGVYQRVKQRTYHGINQGLNYPTRKKPKKKLTTEPHKNMKLTTEGTEDTENRVDVAFAPSTLRVNPVERI